MAVPNEEAQFLETQSSGIEICRIFRGHAPLVGDLEHADVSNFEHDLHSTSPSTPFVTGSTD
jgi:hypothetical protein